MAASVLLVLAHPAYHRSRANAALIGAVSDMENVHVHDLYEAYPDYMIDTHAEQQRLLRHDAFVFQHPLYWYSTPGLLKEWFDLVLTHGFAYGEKGLALKGRPWLTAVTAGGREDAYRPAGPNRFSMPEMLRPIEATAHLCGCAWQEPFVVHASHLMDNYSLATAAQNFRRRIAALRDHTKPRGLED